MQRISIWKGTSEESAFQALNQDIEVDVAIVGGGITGVTTAMLLAREGKRVAVLEAEQIGSGTTHHSTGNLYAMLSHNLFSVREKWGDDATRLVAQSRGAAVDLIEDTVKQYKIDCSFERRPWCFYTTPQGKQKNESVDMEFEALQLAGLAPQYINDLPLPFTLEKGIRVENQAQFHPLRFTRGLAKSIASDRCAVFEHTQVIDFDADNGTVRTDRGTVKCGQIVLATHTPKGINMVQAEMIASQEFGLAARLNGAAYPEGIFWGYDETRHSFRSYMHNGEQYLIVVGEMHHTGHDEDTEQIFDRLAQFTRSSFSVDAIDYTWLGQHYHPADKLPYIGKSAGASNLYIATGFSTDGLTFGPLSAMIITDDIMERSNPWQDLYKATRIEPVKGGKQILKENKDVVMHLARDYLTSKEVKGLDDIRPGDGGIVEMNGDKLAVYRDNQGVLTALSPVCTHMKCMVHWNNAEKTWDCPCHGSRFSTDGSVVEGPALQALERKQVGG